VRPTREKKLLNSLRCPVCNGYKEPGFTTFTADLGENLVVIHNVPATICNQCGEEWVDNKIAQQVETVVEEARAKKHQIEVLSF
jgi:YgiT-type zinc finger domain-containing protein